MKWPVKIDRILVATAYLPPVEYVAWMLHSRVTDLEQWENYRKQTYRNRCVIAGAGGKLSLTIPVEKPVHGNCLIRDLRISDHGNWRHLHWNAMVAAYRNTPFFEFYEDDFAPFYTKRWSHLLDYNQELLHLICSLIGFDPEIHRTDCYVAGPLWKSAEESSSEILPKESARFRTRMDLRESLDPKKESIPGFQALPYYQVFASKFGFQENVSIVDLLFNMGPESLLVLRDSLGGIKDKR